MNKEQAQTAVTASALIVGGVYSYRRLVEPAINADVKVNTHVGKNRLLEISGFGPLPNVGRFITGFGVVYLVLSLMAQANPNLGGSFAILVAVGDVLGNGTQLAADVNNRLGAGGGSTPSTAGGRPVYDPSKETGAQYDKRLGDWLLAHPPRVTNRPMVTTVPGVNPLFPANPLTGSPFPR